MSGIEEWPRFISVSSVLRLLVTTAISSDIFLGLGHPQCLDFRPPFDIIDPPLSFCSNYSRFGCCDRKRDLAIKESHASILDQMNLDHESNLSASRENQKSTCGRFLKDILCLECSPYSAHVFDAEFTGRRRQFPGLCRNYSSRFFRLCRVLISHLTDDRRILQTQHDPYPKNVTTFKSSRIYHPKQESTSHSPDFETRVEERFYEEVRLRDETYCFPDLLTNRTLAMGIEDAVEGRTVDGCLCLEEIAAGLRNPVLLRSTPDSTGRLFVVEQLGRVLIFLSNKTRLPDPFLDLRHLVASTSRFAEERGLLGLTFHPEFRKNGRLYVYYSLKGPAATTQELIRISELIVDASDPNRANETYERVILEIVQPYPNHNGGEILFGVDGFLYAFIGDGGSGGDPHGHAQNMTSLLGKVIRIDVDRADPHRGTPYAIPTDNPFQEQDGEAQSPSRPEIFACGIRNTWRCDVDEGHPETGDGLGRIICGDVGQSAYEEINLIERGGNYGWNAFEGPSCFHKDLCEATEGSIDPIFSYPHSVGQSIIGGHVYRGCLNPNLEGQYFYGDFMNGKLFRLIEDRKSGTWKNEDLRICGPEVCSNGLRSSYEKHILSFGEDSDGEIYLLSTSWPSPTSPTGKVYKIIDPRRRGDPAKCRSNKIKLNKEENSQRNHNFTSTPNRRLNDATKIPDGQGFHFRLAMSIAVLVKGFTWDRHSA